ncbi:MAG: sulfotransferase [Myxococcota bacterium]
MPQDQVGRAERATMSLPAAARAHLAAGRPAPALGILVEHLARDPSDAVAWDAAAEALLSMRKPEDAVAAARQAFDRAGTADAAALVAVALAHSGRTADAGALLDAVLAEPPDAARGWERIARAFEALGEPARGIEARIEARRRAPDDAGVALRLAERLEHADRRDESRATSAGRGAAADRLRVRLDHHDGAFDAAAARAEALLADPTGADGVRQSLWMELARIEAKRGRPAAAFAAATRGNALALAAWIADGGDPDRLPRTLDRLAAAPRPPLPPPSAAEPPRVAFVVGFPRSGTTLVQQILDAHPGTQCLEELPLLDGALGEVLPTADLADALARVADPSVASAVRGAYLRRVRARIPVDDRLVIDKLPLNLLRVELIARVFPGAPIVAVVRDPRDAVLSAFLQDFELNVAMAQCADLERCARLYARAFDGWLRARTTLPRAVELRYEGLVTDPAPTLAPVLATLGLPWDDRVLDHRAVAGRSGIGTPSYREVRKPLHAGNVARWRAFATELAPALPILAPYAEALGYPA